MMQELLLPSRQLFYGRSQVFWQCRAGFRAAEEAAGVNYIPDSHLLIPALSTVLQS